jgi:hypothetical protein
MSNAHDFKSLVCIECAYASIANFPLHHENFLFSFYFLSFPICISLIPGKNKTTLISFYFLKRQSILSISDDIDFSNMT